MIQATIVISQDLTGWRISQRLTEVTAPGVGILLGTSTSEYPLEMGCDDHDALSLVYCVLLRHIDHETSIGQADDAPNRADQ